MENHPRIEIMDTTLRDGEQTNGVSFVPHERNHGHHAPRWRADQWRVVRAP